MSLKNGGVFNLLVPYLLTQQLCSDHVVSRCKLFVFTDHVIASKFNSLILNMARKCTHFISKKPNSAKSRDVLPKLVCEL